MSLNRLTHGLSVLRCARTWRRNATLVRYLAGGWAGSGFGAASNHQRQLGRIASRFYSSDGGEARNTYIREVRTLRPDRMRSTCQSILNLSAKIKPKMRFQHASTHGVIHACYPSGSGGFVPFPTNTKGVFYYDEAESQIRFRLCTSLGDFQQGTDLHNGPQGSVWRIPLLQMARNPQYYGAALSLLKEEFQIKTEDVDPNLDNHREVVTFSPKRLVQMNQRIFNVSGLHKVLVWPAGSSPESSILRYATTTERVSRAHISCNFPPATSGVFYYRQSQVAPTQIGELRFRICSDIQTVDQGQDLRVPSGQVWFLSSRALHLGRDYQAVRGHLVKEGLLERDLYPGIPESLITANSPHVTRLREPFIVNLANGTFVLTLVTRQPEASSSQMRFILAQKTHGVTRRAVVHLEEYPAEYLPKCNQRAYPLLAMRVLEMVESTEHFSAEDYSLRVEPGELVMKGSRPWGFGGDPDGPIRKIVEGWLGAQSVSSDPSQRS